MNPTAYRPMPADVKARHAAGYADVAFAPTGIAAGDRVELRCGRDKGAVVTVLDVIVPDHHAIIGYADGRHRLVRISGKQVRKVATVAPVPFDNGGWEGRDDFDDDGYAPCDR